MAFSRVSGSNVWRNSTGKALGIAPAPLGGVYVVSGSGVHRLGSDGTEWWVAGTNYTSAPVLGSDGSLYVGAGTAGVVALGEDGAQKWLASTEGAVVGTPAVGLDGTVFVGTAGGMFHAFTSNGAERWHFRTGTPIRTPVSLTAQGEVVFGTDEGFVWALRV